MTVLWWILGVLLALLVLLCLTRVGVHVTFGALSLDVKVGCFRIPILPKKEGKRAEKKQEKPAEEAKKAGTEKKKPAMAKPSIAEVREAVSVLWPPLKRALDRTRRGIRIRPLRLCVTLAGGDDPASAAQLYGVLHGIVWTVMPALEKLLDIREPYIHIGMDFDAVQTAVEGEAGITARIGTLLRVVATVAFPALKWFLRYQKRASAIESVRKDGHDGEQE